MAWSYAWGGEGERGARTHPDNALLVRLLVQPVRPLVRDKFKVKSILTSHFRNDTPVVWRHVVADDPKLHPEEGVGHYTCVT